MSTKYDEFKARVGDAADELLTQLMTAWEQEQAADQRGHEFKAADPDVATKADGDPAATDTEDPAADAATDDTVYVGDMLPDEFAQLVAKAVAQALQQPTSYPGSINISTSSLAQLQQMLGGVATKAAEEQATRVTAVTEELAQLKAAREQAEQAHAATLDTIDQRIKALEGEQPRSVQRSSQAASTVVKADDAGDPPAPDPAMQSSQELARLSSWIVSP